jgi:hypothetical protein
MPWSTGCAVRSTHPWARSWGCERPSRSSWCTPAACLPASRAYPGLHPGRLQCWLAHERQAGGLPPSSLMLASRLLTPLAPAWPVCRMTSDASALRPPCRWVCGMCRLVSASQLRRAGVDAYNIELLPGPLGLLDAHSTQRVCNGLPVAHGRSGARVPSPRSAPTLVSPTPPCLNMHPRRAART